MVGYQKLALAADPVKVDGSSTVFPITEAVAEEFGKSGGGKVIVGISGTGVVLNVSAAGKRISAMPPGPSSRKKSTLAGKGVSSILNCRWLMTAWPWSLIRKTPGWII